MYTIHRVMRRELHVYIRNRVCVRVLNDCVLACLLVCSICENEIRMARAAYMPIKFPVFVYLNTWNERTNRWAVWRSQVHSIPNNELATRYFQINIQSTQLISCSLVGFATTQFQTISLDRSMKTTHVCPFTSFWQF